ncbi:MAG TPA: cytochrome c oxidase subunit 3 family protein [Candidatus Limnocylindria bacterium]|nr:cytochrome c oxidase subunit 3 family protein [Candidatus Limnocylindria bacterium]
MPQTPEVLAHQFDDLEQQHDAANLGMWAFLATEILFFGGMFLGYAVYRSLYPEAFAQASNHMDILLGMINTVVLIASSLTVVLAVHAAQHDRRRALVRLLMLTILLGLVFLGIKSTEYLHKFNENLVPGVNFAYTEQNPRQAALFFSFYFAMTGMHALHMIIGIAIFVWLVITARRGRYNSIYYTPVEIAGLYWHFVDIIWIFLFPLFYLLGRHL